MKDDFEAAKYGRFWAVFEKVSRTFSYIGMGKKFCKKKAQELNEYCKQKEEDARKDISNRD